MKKIRLLFVCLLTLPVLAYADPDSTRCLHALSAGTDITRIFLLGNESFIRYEWKGRLALKFGFGFTAFNGGTVYNNLSNYHSNGFFMKPGAQVLLPLGKKVKLMVGAAYARSFYNEGGTIAVNSKFWGTTGEFPFHLKGNVTSAIEYEGGLQIKSRKRLSVCVSLKTRNFLQSLAPSQSPFFNNNRGEKYESYCVPGLGFPGAPSNIFWNMGFSLDLIYTLPFAKPQAPTTKY